MGGEPFQWGEMRNHLVGKEGTDKKAFTNKMRNFIKKKLLLLFVTTVAPFTKAEKRKTARVESVRLKQEEDKASSRRKTINGAS